MGEKTYNFSDIFARNLAEPSKDKLAGNSDISPDEHSGANIWNMPSGADFLPALAEGLSAALGDDLPNALILLPTRRAIRELGEAFVQLAARDPKRARRAALLPSMRPLADMDPDEPPFEPGDLAHKITPAISSVRRRFELSNLVLAKEARLRARAPDAAGALAMSDPLLRLLDDVAMEEMDMSRLSQLEDIAQMSAAHYKEAEIFYRIVQRHWPAHLKEAGFMEPMARRVKLLRELAAQWEQNPPARPVIIAGSTGTLPATANLMRVVARQKGGLIVLPGLDLNIDDEAVWNNIDESPNHPQYALKRLLGLIGAPRSEVRIWPAHNVGFKASARRRLIAEALIPADNTGDWRARVERMRASAPDDPISAGIEGLSLIEARNEDEEASVIALAMRDVLRTPQKTAALVTPDPALGRRVRAKLSRWNVEVDVSAGAPLEESQAGRFFALILALAQEPWDAISLAALFKHPLSALGHKPARLSALWRGLEQAAFRGAAPKTGEALTRRLEDDRKYNRHIAPDALEQARAALDRFHALLTPLSEPYSEEQALCASEFARRLAQIAEQIAAPDSLIKEGADAGTETGTETGSETGAARLWAGEDGEAAAGLIRDLLEHGHILQPMDGPAFTRLSAQLMRGRVVRPRFGTHPRLQILGPLEARMLSADLIILGGLNEGIWPAAPSIDPLLSANMRAALGLSAPERRYGLAAHDFAQLAAHENVLLTRALKTADGPAVASRWIWRLQTLLRGALGNPESVDMALGGDKKYLSWARALDHVPAAQVKAAQEPLPCPPLKDRWPNGRALPVTQIEKWVRDPYSIFAGRILKLRPLDALGQAVGPREFGSALHQGLENFTRRYEHGVAQGAGDWLAAELSSQLISAGFAPESLASETVRLTQIAHWFARWDRARRKLGFAPAGVEVSGKLSINLPHAEPFILTAEADRIDKGLEGHHIIDYKTGAPPSTAQVRAGFSPQLTLEGAILEVNGFAENGANIAPAEPQDYLYVQLGKNAANRKEQSPLYERGKKTISAQELAGKAYEGLMELIALFDDPDMPYRSQPRAKNVNPYGDYDHLARRSEWASAGDEADSS